MNAVMRPSALRPQDILLLTHLVINPTPVPRKAKDVAAELWLSPAEVSLSISRCTWARLISGENRMVSKAALMEAIVYGVPYFFAQHPQGLARGVATAHSHPFCRNTFASQQVTVWPHPAGTERGLAVTPLYPAAVDAAIGNPRLYWAAALIDMLRIGRAREKDFAKAELKKLFNG